MSEQGSEFTFPFDSWLILESRAAEFGQPVELYIEGTVELGLSTMEILFYNQEQVRQTYLLIEDEVGTGNFTRYLIDADDIRSEDTIDPDLPPDPFESELVRANTSDDIREKIHFYAQVLEVQAKDLGAWFFMLRQKFDLASSEAKRMALTYGDSFVEICCEPIEEE